MQTVQQNLKKVQFAHREKGVDFFSTVRSRVESYFKTNHLSTFATPGMHLKNLLIFFACITLYLLIIMQQFNVPILCLLMIMLGLLFATLLMNIAHDAAHGSYSQNKSLNQILSYLFDFIGRSSAIWKITHNQEHHTYTNIHGLDSDIHQSILIRLSPGDPLYWFHRYQAWYVFFLYSLSAINIFFFSSIFAIFQELKKKKPAIKIKDVIIFFLFRAVHIFLFIIIPYMVMSLSFLEILAGYFLMLLFIGLYIAIVFEVAHIVVQTEFIEENGEGKLPFEWAVHQLRTTCNFSIKNPVVCWILGGLNFQIEHHLFPQIAHGHYKNISGIVRTTAKEFNIPYNENPTIIAAIYSHLKQLNRLGQPNN